MSKFGVGLIGHTSNKCCPLCTFASNHKNPHFIGDDDDSNAMSSEPSSNEPKRKKTTQSFAWDILTEEILLETEGKRDHDEYVANHLAFRNKLYQGASVKDLAAQAVLTGMRDTCVTRLLGFDFGRSVKYKYLFCTHQKFRRHVFIDYFHTFEMGVVKSTICFLLADMRPNEYSAFCERMKMLVKVCSFFSVQVTLSCFTFMSIVPFM